MNHLDTDIQDYPDDLVYETYPDDELGEPVDQRWRPVSIVAAVVLVLAVIATVVILNGGDSASTSATVVAPTRTVIATPRPTPRASLPPETVTTVTPPPQAPPSADPPVAASAVPPPAAAAPVPPEVSARTVVYQVTGTKQLFDLVNVIYTDDQGIPHTDFNVSLPWSKTIVLNPGVQTRSVVATSITGRLNCAITDAQGQAVAVSANNALIATCTR